MDMATLRAAHFRHQQKKKGKAFCLVCKGVTLNASYRFCNRHWRALPFDLRSNDPSDDDERIAYLTGPRPLKVARDGYESAHMALSLRSSDRKSGPIWILRRWPKRDGHEEELATFTTISQAQRYVADLAQDMSTHNRTAKKALIR